MLNVRLEPVRLTVCTGGLGGSLTTGDGATGGLVGLTAGFLAAWVAFVLLGFAFFLTFGA